MSNLVTNADIEDVLSSIRRLVSEEARPQVAPPVAQGMGRLVLTPALRVMETVAPDEDSDQQGNQPDSSADDACAGGDLPQPELVEAHELLGVKPDDTGRRNLEARIAELEAVISDAGGVWEQDGEEGSANAGDALESLPWDGSLAEPDPVEEAPFQNVEESVVSATIARFAVPDEFTGAADTLSGDTDPSDMVEVEPDFEPDDYEPEALGYVEEAEPHTEPVTEEVLEETLAGQDVVVDEDMLRALVAEIVREELQGKLGERITRNVRKLVRREILRALASQDME
ncbi:hypothetical protein SAMN06265173_1256 [Thalassovita litoralis]|uniref:Uncharacterized protein n=1 Tax=Thalassovita litoralis TaxID=1010611 RepID=A0A521F8F4_9RHOB|nr:hypothetical protein [Thalassovita litoralis]SMO92492.1 hypothetical protein SAMN06265173_1256 [Thalassovita litoralis]